MRYPTWSRPRWCQGLPSRKCTRPSAKTLNHKLLVLAEAARLLATLTGATLVSPAWLEARISVIDALEEEARLALTPFSRFLSISQQTTFSSTVRGPVRRLDCGKALAYQPTEGKLSTLKDRMGREQYVTARN